MELTFKLDESPSNESLETLSNGLTGHALPITNAPGFETVAIFARDPENTIVAGISGEINWNWLYVANFWVHEQFRDSGIGSTLLSRFEAYAKKRGCDQVHLDTFSFQAPIFYEKQGYSLFAALENYPPGHKRCFYKKSL